MSSNMDKISGGPSASPSFACGMCGKCFSDAEQIKIHIQTHTGKQPFRCVICWPLFYDMSSSQPPEPSPMLLQPAALPMTGSSHFTAPPTGPLHPATSSATATAHLTSPSAADTAQPVTPQTPGTFHLTNPATSGALNGATSRSPKSHATETEDAVPGKMKSAEQTAAGTSLSSDSLVDTEQPLFFQPHSPDYANGMSTGVQKSSQLVGTQDIVNGTKSHREASFAPILEKESVLKTSDANASHAQSGSIESDTVSSKAKNLSSSVNEKGDSQTSSWCSSRIASTGPVEDAHVPSGDELIKPQPTAAIASVASSNLLSDISHSSSEVVETVSQHSPGHLFSFSDTQTVAVREADAGNSNSSLEDTQQSSLNSTNETTSVSEEHVVVLKEESSLSQSTDRESHTNCGRRKKGRPKKLAGDAPLPFYLAERLRQEAAIQNDHMYSMSVETGLEDHQTLVETQFESSEADDSELEINQKSNASKNASPQESCESQTVPVTVPLKTYARKTSQNLRKASPQKHSTKNVHRENQSNDANEKEKHVNFQGVINFLKNVQVRKSSATGGESRSTTTPVTRSSTTSGSEAAEQSKPLVLGRKGMYSASDERSSPQKTPSKRRRDDLGRKSAAEGSRENEPVSARVRSSSDRHSVHVLRKGKPPKTSKKGTVESKTKSSAQLAESGMAEGTQRRRKNPEVQHGNIDDISNSVSTSKQRTLTSAREGDRAEKHHLIHASATRSAAKQRLEMAEVNQETESDTDSVPRQTAAVAALGTDAQKTCEDSQERGTDVGTCTANEAARNEATKSSKSHSSMRKSFSVKSTETTTLEIDSFAQSSAEVTLAAGVSSAETTNTKMSTVAENVAGVVSKGASSFVKVGQDKLKEITGLSIPEVIAAARVAKGSTGGSASSSKTRVIIVSPSAPQSPPLCKSVLASAIEIPAVTSIGKAATVISTTSVQNTSATPRQPVTSSQAVYSSHCAEQPFSGCAPSASSRSDQSSDSADLSKPSVWVDETSSGVPSTVSEVSSELSVTPSASLYSVTTQLSRTLSAGKGTVSPSSTHNSSARQEMAGGDPLTSTSVILKNPEVLKLTAKIPVVSLPRIEDSALKELKSGKSVSVTCDQSVNKNTSAAHILLDTDKSAADSNSIDISQDLARVNPSGFGCSDFIGTFLSNDEENLSDPSLTPPRREMRLSPRKPGLSSQAEKTNKSPHKQKTGPKNVHRQSSPSKAETAKKPEREKLVPGQLLEHSPKTSLQDLPEMTESQSSSECEMTQSIGSSAQETSSREALQKQENSKPRHLNNQEGDNSDSIQAEAAHQHIIQDTKKGIERECVPSTCTNETRPEDSAAQKPVQTIHFAAAGYGTVIVSDFTDSSQAASDLEKYPAEFCDDVQTSEVVVQVSTDSRNSPTKTNSSEQVSDMVLNTVTNLSNNTETLCSNLQKQGTKRKVRLRVSAEKQLLDASGGEFNLQELFTPVHKLRKRGVGAVESQDGGSNSKFYLDTDSGYKDASLMTVAEVVHCDPSQSGDDDESSLNTYDLPVTFAGETTLTSYCHSLDLTPRPHGNVQTPSGGISKHQRIRQARHAVGHKKRGAEHLKKFDKPSATKPGNSSQTRPAVRVSEDRRNKLKFPRKLKTTYSHLSLRGQRTKRASSKIPPPCIFTPSVTESVKRAEMLRKSVIHLHPAPDLETIVAQIAKNTKNTTESQIRFIENTQHIHGNKAAGDLNTPAKQDIYPKVRVTPGHFSLGKVSQYVCKKCGAKFKKYSKYLFHKRNQCKDRFECDICGVTLGRRESLKTHRMIHTGEAAARCNVCGKTLCSQASLATHMRIHTGERPYSCPLCPKTFRQQPGLVSHYRTHTRDRPFKCNICGKSYRFQKNLYNHKFTHTGERRYVCKICGASYFQLAALNVHYKLHRGEKPYGCDYCSMTFMQKKNRLNHISQAHQDKIRAKEEARIKNVGKPFRCSSCSRGFTTVRARHRHMKLYCMSVLSEAPGTEETS